MARVLVDELVRHGLRHAVVSPGSRSTALVLAAEAHERVAVHVCLDERSAAFVALGIGRATGVPAAMITTSGSAVANLHPAIIEASYADVPLLALTADRPPELLATGANQTIDQTGIFGGAVRWFGDPGVAKDVADANQRWREFASRAWSETIGATGRAGPVHLNLPFVEPTVPRTDDGRTRGEPFLGSIDGGADGRPWTDARRTPMRAEDEVADLADRLRAAGRPLLLLGDGDYVPAPVTQLARAAEMPMVAEPLSNARRGASGIAHGHLLVGAGLLPAPDLVVRIGRSNLSRPIEQWLTADVPQVVVDRHGRFLDPGRTRDRHVAADPDLFAAAVAADLRATPPPDTAAERLATWREADARVTGIVESAFAAEEHPSGPAVARRLVADLPTDTALVIASSAPIRDVDAYAPLREDLWMVGNRGASGIDGFVSTALGIALTRSGAAGGPTVALAGDLSFLHDQGAWLLRPDPGLPEPDVVVVVLDNDGGGLFHHLPVAAEPAFERLFATPHGLDLGAVARAHGVQVAVPSTVDEVAKAVLDGIDAGGRHLVHVRTDRDRDRALRARIAEAVAGMSRLDR